MRLRKVTYPHYEQNEYSTDLAALLDPRAVNSSRLPASICIAALQGWFSRPGRLGFSCGCINSPQRGRLGPEDRQQRPRKWHGSIRRRPRSRTRHRQLADAASDHRLRLRYRPVELRSAIEPRLFHSADEPRVFLGPRHLRPRAGRAESAVGLRPAACRRDRRPLRRRARHVRRRRALCRPACS